MGSSARGGYGGDVKVNNVLVSRGSCGGAGSTGTGSVGCGQGGGPGGTPFAGYSGAFGGGGAGAGINYNYVYEAVASGGDGYITFEWFDPSEAFPNIWAELEPSE